MQAKNKVIQIMPIYRRMPMQSGCTLSWQESNRSGTDNITWHIMGAALMEDGRILPLVWDGFLQFKAVDPAMKEFAAIIDRMATAAEKANKEHSNAEQREKQLHDAGIVSENAPAYWDALTSGEYPRTAEAAKMLKLDAEDKQVNGGKVVLTHGE